MSAAVTVDTRTATRRVLSLETLAALSAELNRLEAAHRAGTLRSTGNWTPGENLDHLARAMRPSFDGFDFTVAVPIRLVGSLFMKRRFLREGFPRGFKMGPKMSAAFGPRPGVPFEEGLLALREQLSRIDRGERMTHASPGLGALTHDEWVRLHLRHAELHLAYLNHAG